MTVIPEDIQKLIERLYPDHHYSGPYSKKPTWIDYDYQNKIDAVVKAIKKQSDVRIEIRLDPVWDIAYNIKIIVPNVDVFDVKNRNALLKTVNPIAVMSLMISMLGPYAAIIGWGHIYLDEQFEWGHRYDFVEKPPTEAARGLEEVVKQILYENKLNLLSTELLRTEISYFTGPELTHAGHKPAVINCLFSDSAIMEYDK